MECSDKEEPICFYKDARLIVRDLAMEGEETAPQLIGIIFYLILLRYAIFVSHFSFEEWRISITLAKPCIVFLRGWFTKQFLGFFFFGKNLYTEHHEIGNFFSMGKVEDPMNLSNFVGIYHLIIVY